MKTQIETLSELHRETADAVKDLLDFEENQSQFSGRTRDMLRTQAYGRVKEVLLRSEEFFRANPE